MDEYFNSFLHEEGFAPIVDSTPVDEETLNFFRGKLPDRLLTYWQEYGFAGFGEGLFWLVNPKDYQDTVDKWLRQTPFWGRENFYAISRTAFGKLYIRGDKSDDETVIDPHLNNILPGNFDALPLSKDIQERGIGMFFMCKSKKSVDYRDSNDKYLFQRCLKKLGTLEQDEMYSFSPPLALGGSPDIDHVKKVKIPEQLSMLCDLDAPYLLKSTDGMFGPL